MPVSLAGTSAATTHGALVPIAYYSGNNTSGVVVFSNIPQIYQDLMIVIKGRSTQSAIWSGINFFLNADGTTSNYSRTRLQGDGSTNSYRDNSSSGAGAAMDCITGANATSGVFSSHITHILNYANTSTYKTMLSRTAMDANGSGYVYLWVNLWRSTSAVSSIQLNTYSGNYDTGTTIELFGVRTVGQ